jgi:hypothetical protein
MNGYLTRSVINEAKQVLEDTEYRRAMVDHNFNLAQKYYSYEVLERRLGYLLSNIFGLDSE